MSAIRTGSALGGWESMRNRLNRVWFFSEVYYPEETGTGYYVTRIAEHFAQNRPVSAITAQPSYSKAGRMAPRRELHNGVDIHRCSSYLPSSKSLGARMLKIFSITLSMLIVGLTRVRRGDSIVAVTNPPSVPILAWLLSLIFGVRYYLIVHDIHPDIAAACGVISRHSLQFRFLRWLNRLVLRRATKITALGYDMCEYLADLRGLEKGAAILMIPIWSDCDDEWPTSRGGNPLLRRLGLMDKFVVLYAGNMSSPHGIKTIVNAAKMLKAEQGIHFLFIGSGPKRTFVEAAAKAGEANITVLDPRPRSEQNEFMSACDVSILSLVEGMLGLAVPSRTYNVMAAGKPLIAVVSSKSDTARIVREENIGWAVEPGDADRLVEVILSARRQPEVREEMSLRARRAAETKYSQKMILARFDDLLADETAAPAEGSRELTGPSGAIGSARQPRGQD